MKSKEEIKAKIEELETKEQKEFQENITAEFTITVLRWVLGE